MIAARDNGVVSDDPTTSAQSATERAARPSRRFFWLTIALALVVIAADQGTKWWAESELSDGRTVPFIGDFIRFVLVYNPGAAFSIGTEFTWVFAILTGLAVIFIAVYAWRVRSKGWAIALGLLLGGAATHLGDRLFRDPGFGRGHVVDFIAYADFFIGNVADIAIFFGAVSLVIVTLIPKHGDDPDSADDAAEAAAAPDVERRRDAE